MLSGLRARISRFIGSAMQVFPDHLSERTSYLRILGVASRILPSHGIINAPVLYGSADLEWDLSINSCRYNFSTGTNSRYVSRLVLEALRRFPSAHFIDCGANVGIYSRLALDLGATVTAIEPQSQLAKRLEWANIQQCAISNTEGTVTLYVPAQSVGMASIQKDIVSSRKFLDSVTEEVRVRRLSEFIKDDRQNIIKIDVEGHELDVISSIGSRRDSVIAAIIEIAHSNIDSIIDRFRSIGLEPAALKGGKLCLLKVIPEDYPYSDLLFLRSDYLADC